MKLRLTMAVLIGSIALLASSAACTSPNPEFDAPTPADPYDLNQRVAALEKEAEEEQGTIQEQLIWLQEENAAIRAEMATLTTSGALPNNDICGRSPDIQQILIRELGLPSCQIINDRELLRISQLTISSDRLWSGDLEGLHNVETLKLYLGNSPPEDLLQSLDKLQDLTLQFKKEGPCGRIQLHGENREIGKSGENCKLKLGH